MIKTLAVPYTGKSGTYFLRKFFIQRWKKWRDYSGSANAPSSRWNKQFLSPWLGSYTYPLNKKSNTGFRRFNKKRYIIQLTTSRWNTKYSEQINWQYYLRTKHYQRTKYLLREQIINRFIPLGKRQEDLALKQEEIRTKVDLSKNYFEDFTSFIKWKDLKNYNLVKDRLIVDPWFFWFIFNCFFLNSYVYLKSLSKLLYETFDYTSYFRYHWGGNFILALKRWKLDQFQRKRKVKLAYKKIGKQNIYYCDSYLDFVKKHAFFHNMMIFYVHIGTREDRGNTWTEWEEFFIHNKKRRIEDMAFDWISYDNFVNTFVVNFFEDLTTNIKKKIQVKIFSELGKYASQMKTVTAFFKKSVKKKNLSLISLRFHKSYIIGINTKFIFIGDVFREYFNNHQAFYPFKNYASYQKKLLPYNDIISFYPKLPFFLKDQLTPLKLKIHYELALNLKGKGISEELKNSLYALSLSTFFEDLHKNSKIPWILEILKRCNLYYLNKNINLASIKYIYFSIKYIMNRILLLKKNINLRVLTPYLFLKKEIKDLIKPVTASKILKKNNQKICEKYLFFKNFKGNFFCYLYFIYIFLLYNTLKKIVQKWTINTSKFQYFLILNKKADYLVYNPLSIKVINYINSLVKLKYICTSETLESRLKKIYLILTKYKYIYIYKNLKTNIKTNIVPLGNILHNPLITKPDTLTLNYIPEMLKIWNYPIRNYALNNIGYLEVYLDYYYKYYMIHHRHMYMKNYYLNNVKAKYYNLLKYRNKPLDVVDIKYLLINWLAKSINNKISLKNITFITKDFYYIQNLLNYINKEGKTSSYFEDLNTNPFLLYKFLYRSVTFKSTHTLYSYVNARFINYQEYPIILSWERYKTSLYPIDYVDRKKYIYKINPYDIQDLTNVSLKSMPQNIDKKWNKDPSSLEAPSFRDFLDNIEFINNFEKKSAQHARYEKQIYDSRLFTFFNLNLYVLAFEGYIAKYAKVTKNAKFMYSSINHLTMKEFYKHVGRDTPYLLGDNFMSFLYPIVLRMHILRKPKKKRIRIKKIKKRREFADLFSLNKSFEDMPPKKKEIKITPTTPFKNSIKEKYKNYKKTVSLQLRGIASKEPLMVLNEMQSKDYYKDKKINAKKYTRPLLTEQEKKDRYEKKVYQFYLKTKWNMQYTRILHFLTAFSAEYTKICSYISHALLIHTYDYKYRRINDPIVVNILFQEEVGGWGDVGTFPLESRWRSYARMNKEVVPKNLPLLPEGKLPYKLHLSVVHPYNAFRKEEMYRNINSNLIAREHLDKVEYDHAWHHHHSVKKNSVESKHIPYKDTFIYPDTDFFINNLSKKKKVL